MKTATASVQHAAADDPSAPETPRRLSIVVPVYNEHENLKPLHAATVKAMEKLGASFELILINDGSKDSSGEVMDALAMQDARVLAAHLGRNSGQTAAIMAGIEMAQGDIVIIMDADLQNDPADIGKLLVKIDEGYDVSSGWRKNRKDHPLKRNLPSRAANWLISRISGVHLHDYGCSLKAYRRDIIKNVNLYGEMHRFIPIYAALLGAKVAEIPVSHRSRTHGTSKYGLERVGKVLLDLLVVKFLMKYSQKPMHIFGSFGLLCLAGSVASFLYMLYLKFFAATTFIETPLPLLTVLFAMIGVNALFMGIIAEMIMRTWFESQNKKTYNIVRITSQNQSPGCR
jgi:glycosyltransferase involved in cell wall biosynthesis